MSGAFVFSLSNGGGFGGAGVHCSQYLPLDCVSIDNVCPHCWQNFIVMKKSDGILRLLKEVAVLSVVVKVDFSLLVF